MEAGVVAVLHPREPLEPLAGQVTSEATKVHCDDLVDRLRLAIGLWVECRGQLQLYSGHGEELRPKFAGEDGISVADYGAWNHVEPHNVVKERPHHRRRRAGVPERNEMCIRGEAVDDRQHNGLAIDVGETFHEVHHHVSPHRRWNIEGLEEADVM
jgi:hypothetical protein